MTRDELLAFCLQLPGARVDYKWGSNQVFSVAHNKMFAIVDFLGDNLAFKVDDTLFLGFTDRPGIRPAPYLARAHWISMNGSRPPMGDDELRDPVSYTHLTLPTTPYV